MLSKKLLLLTIAVSTLSLGSVFSATNAPTAATDAVPGVAIANDGAKPADKPVEPAGAPSAAGTADAGAPSSIVADPTVSHKPADKPTDKPANRPADTSTDTSTDKSTDKSADKIADSSTNKTDTASENKCWSHGTKALIYGGIGTTGLGLFLGRLVFIKDSNGNPRLNKLALRGLMERLKNDGDTKAALAETLSYALLMAIGAFGATYEGYHMGDAKKDAKGETAKKPDAATASKPTVKAAA